VPSTRRASPFVDGVGGPSGTELERRRRTCRRCRRAVGPGGGGGPPALPAEGITLGSARIPFTSALAIPNEVPASARPHTIDYMRGSQAEHSVHSSVLPSGHVKPGGIMWPTS
jgi:hypothetical protein